MTVASWKKFPPFKSFEKQRKPSMTKLAILVCLSTECEKQSLTDRAIRCDILFALEAWLSKLECGWFLPG